MAKTLNDVLPEILKRGDAATPTANTSEAAPAEGQATPTETAPQAQPTTEPTAPAQTTPQPEAQVSQQAAQTPPTTAQAPAGQQSDPRVEALLKAAEATQKLQAENAQLKQQVEQLSASTKQQSQAAEAAITNTLIPPKMNLDGWEYLSDADRGTRQQEYADAMAKYTEQNIMQKLSPVMQDFQQRTKEAQYSAARNALTSAPELSGLMDDMPGIDRIIAQTPELQNMDPQKQLLLGSLINKGIKAVNEKAKAPTPEEIAAQAASNPEVMRLLKAKEAQSAAEKNKGLPPLSANSGMASTPATPPKKPTSFTEAFAMSQNYKK